MIFAMCDSIRELGRIAPFTFTDVMDDQVKEVSAITHAHAISVDACAQYVDIVRH